MNGRHPHPARFLLVASYAESLIHFRGALMQAIQDRGIEVHVAAPALPVDSPLRRSLQARGLRVHEYPLRRTGTNPLADARAFVSLLAIIRRVQPTWVLSYTIKPVIYGSMAAWVARVPHRFALVTGLGYAFLGDGRRGQLQRLAEGMYSAALTRVDKVFFQNPDDEALFRSKSILGVHTPSHVLNGSGVDLATFAAMPAQRPGQPMRFLLIARLLGDKGIREYVEAARIIRRERPDVSFDLVGWIDENPDSIEKGELDAWVAEGSIRFLGRLDDVRPAIAAASVYVLPSYREGTPRTILEAMAIGRPVITTDVPGCRETIVDGWNGYLVEVKSVGALVAAMRRLIDQPDQAEIMGQRSRELAESKYDVHRVNAEMLREMGIA